MPANGVILYPSQSTERVYSTFSACGTAEVLGAGRLSAKLKAVGGGQEHAGTLLRDAPRWVFHFQNVEEGEYVLSLYENNEKLDWVPVKVLARRDKEPDEEAVKKKAPHVGLDLIHPPQGATVPGDFTANGISDNAHPVTGTIFQPGASPIVGVTLKQPPPLGDWVIHFTNVPAGEDYCILVTSLVDSDTHCDISVSP